MKNTKGFSFVDLLIMLVLLWVAYTIGTVVATEKCRNMPAKVQTR
ncbi:MAG: hypothetical protein QXL17_02865 [Candidatus Thermoplasmatota archaeon]